MFRWNDLQVWHVWQALACMQFFSESLTKTIQQIMKTQIIPNSMDCPQHCLDTILHCSTKYIFEMYAVVLYSCHVMSNLHKENLALNSVCPSWARRPGCSLVTCALKVKGSRKCMLLGFMNMNLLSFLDFFSLSFFLQFSQLLSKCPPTLFLVHADAAVFCIDGTLRPRHLAINPLLLN